MKSFGPTAAQRNTPVHREPFEFTFMRDDEPETHRFVARAVTDMTGLASLFTAVKKNPEQALPEMLGVIAKMLDNKDGTPAKWQPVALPIPEGLPEEERPERMFRAPNGELYPVAEADRFLTFEAGSSRRRWLHLINEDDELTTDSTAITSLFEWLAGLAAGRPTQPSS